MSCEKISNALIAYLDGRASGQERGDVEAHLKLCADCRERAEEFRRLWHVMEEVPTVEPSFGFDARLRQRLAAEPQRKAWGWFVPAPRLSFAVALLAILSVWVAARQPVVEPAVGSEAQFRMIKDLGVLENYDVLKNFEPLSDLPAAQEIHDQTQPQQDSDPDSGSGTSN
ncbi:MAG TPA: zf-HC2 domain-containing protein [Candidatus Acidoferrales bacterium]|nr:zf-HC2 domain-containing protein [Candidatus Acidoferrales bacterium]